MHYVIIGNSAAGISAAETVRQLDKTGNITMVSNENTAPYSRCLLSYYLAGEIPKKRLFIRDKKWYRDLNITPLLGRRIISLYPKQKQIVLDNKKKLSYDKLLIATGSSPLFIPIKGTKAQGVFGFRTLQDADNIIRFMRNKSVQSVAVIGAGFIGLKTAYGFWKRGASPVRSHFLGGVPMSIGATSNGVKVTVVEKLNRLMPRMIDKKASDIFRKEFKSKRIDIILGQGVAEIMTQKGKVCGVKLENGKTLPCQMVIMSVGVKPNIDFLARSNVKTNQGIIVDKYLQTNIKNIFAAGDVAETIDALSGQRTINALWSCASAQGRVAAYNMTGPVRRNTMEGEQKRRYDGSMAMNSVEFFGLPVISFGEVNPVRSKTPKASADPPKAGRTSNGVNPSDNKYKIITEINQSKKLYQKIILRENKLVGLILVNNIENAGVYLSLLKRGDVVSGLSRLNR